MRKLNVTTVKTNVAKRVCNVQRLAERAVLKLREQEGSLLEYLGEHIIGVVLIGIILAALVAIVGNTVMPNITEQIKSAFPFTA